MQLIINDSKEFIEAVRLESRVNPKAMSAAQWVFREERAAHEAKYTTVIKNGISNVEISIFTNDADGVLLEGCLQALGKKIVDGKINQ